MDKMAGSKGRRELTELVLRSAAIWRICLISATNASGQEGLNVTSLIDLPSFLAER